ncbi:MAG TPA: M28 family peptidase [Gemmatimonadaceae bacterium]|nr:M28 family peptidase [Gemmatimonadaceae bacterium]
MPKPTVPAITASDLTTRLYIFADDSMQGRQLATEGNVKGVEYIAAEARRMGLVPMGDNGTYFQTVNVVERTFNAATRLAVGTTTFAPWTDYAMRDQGAGARSLDGVQTVFGGTWGDPGTLISDAAAAGKLVVLSAKPNEVSAGISRAGVTRRFPSAAGIAVVNLEQTPPQLLQAYQEPSQFVKGEQDPPLPSYMYVTRRVAGILLNTNIDGARPGTLGATVSATGGFVESPVKYPARNVVALIPGSDSALRNEYVAIGAHNDHIGTSSRAVAHDSLYIVNHLFRVEGADDAAPKLNASQQAEVNRLIADIRRRTNGASARPDSIYNGADDDGSGSVSTLEIAQYFSSQKVKPKRSLLFVWHVGEEEGLYGSAWFTDHPTVPRDSIVAQLNIDMIGRGAGSDVTGATREGAKVHGNADYLQLVGSRRLSTELGNLAETVNAAATRPLSFDYTMDANGHPQVIYCRSDHYEYARYGIPIIFFTTGGHADYHQVTDEPQYVDYDHMARVAQFIADLATRVANLDHRVVVDKAKPDPHGRCVQ